MSGAGRLAGHDRTPHPMRARFPIRRSASPSRLEMESPEMEVLCPEVRTQTGTSNLQPPTSNFQPPPLDRASVSYTHLTLPTILRV